MKIFVRLLLGLCFLALSTPLRGQSPLIDSLQNELSIHTEIDRDRLGVYLGLAEAYVYYDRDSMLHYALLGKELANDLEMPTQYLYAMQREGVYYYSKFSLDTALAIFRKGLKFSRTYNLPERESAFLGSIGIAKFSQGSADSAVYFLEKAYQTDLEQQDTIKMMVRLNNLGAVYLEMDQPAKSLKSIYASLKLALAIGISEKAAFAANNIGVIYERYDSKERAIEYFRIALNNMLETNLGRMSLLSNIAELHLSLNNTDSAAHYYSLAMECPREDDCDLLSAYAGMIDIFLRRRNLDSAGYFVSAAQPYVEICRDSTNLFHYYHMAGKLHRIQKSYTLARGNLEQALLFGKQGMRAYANAHLDFTLLEEALGNYKSALAHAKTYNKATVQKAKAQYNREVARSDLEVAFAEEKNALIQDQNQMQEELSSFQDLRVVWTIASLFFILTMLILLRSYAKGRKLTRGLQELNATVMEQKENLQHKSEQLALSNERIKELSDFRERLAAMAVHDMKGPLSTIIGLSDGEMNGKKQKLIKKAGHQMLNFLMDLLDIYKFEKANIALKLLPYELDGLLKESLQSVQYLAEEKNIHFEKSFPPGLIIPVDEGILIRVLINLLSNAIKYSDTNTKVRIDARTDIQDGRPFLILKIKDQGKGLSEKELDHMFKPMNLRKDNYISKSTSTGIGLDFCKLAIQAHRGHIWAESVLEEGTTIFIKLPLHEVIQQDLSPGSEGAGTEQHIVDLSAFRVDLEALIALKIHEAGQILPALQDLEDRGVDPKWIATLKATVYSANESRYREILLKALQHAV